MFTTARRTLSVLSWMRLPSDGSNGRSTACVLSSSRRVATALTAAARTAGEVSSDACLAMRQFKSRRMSLLGTADQNSVKIRAVAFNTLDFGAMSVMMSARFAYNSAFHPRVFRGNPAALASCAIVTVLQLCLTYIPGLNSFVFSMKGMDGVGWGLVIASMVIVFAVMEIEKAIRRNLKAKGADTDDREQGYFDEQVQPKDNEAMKMPKGASKLNLMEIEH